jgi:glycosyltransferase involved in cell wall biosynthesis
VERISCAMIVRDAESTLERALKSVREHVDELVILDTGSDDGTREIAARYADHLGQKLWKEHFAEMREDVYSRCTGDWILHLDADDELMGGEHLRGLVAGTDPTIGAYLLNYVTSLDAEGRPAFSYWRERLTRRGKYRWRGRVHEVLEPIEPLPYRRFADTWVLHHGHGDGLGSLQRNIRLLRRSLIEEPANARTLFYLGRDLLQIGETDEALLLLQRYRTLSTWLDEAFIAQMLIGHIHRVKGNYPTAYQSDLDLLNLQPMWPQAYFALAEDCYYLGRWRESDHFCRIGQTLPMPDTNIFLAPEPIVSGWMIYQVVALHQMGRTADALELTRRAVQLRPDDKLHAYNLAYFEGLQTAQPNGQPAAIAR